MLEIITKSKNKYSYKFSFRSIRAFMKNIKKYISTGYRICKFEYKQIG